MSQNRKRFSPENTFENVVCEMMAILFRKIKTSRKYKDYVYRKMLVQEYLKKWRIFKRVKPKNDMMFHDIYNCICQNTKK